MNSPSAAPVRSKTILIVDDNPMNIGVVVDHLEHRGFDVAVALGGEEALERAKFLRPDLILLDVMMPGISGFETCRRLKALEETRDIPVIFMTALGDVNDKTEGFAAGGVDYVAKPFQVGDMLARVNAHLALGEVRRQLEDELEAIRDADTGPGAAWRRLFDRAEEGMILVDCANATIADINPAASRMLGANYEALVGRGLAEVVGASAAAALADFGADGVHAPGEWLLQGKSCQVSGSVLHSPEGRFITLNLRASADLAR